ncbi:MAG: YihY/virulence factor BrkB family protein [Dehalococcoidia bacterium]
MAAARLFWKFVLLCKDLVNSFLDMNGAHLAAAITYWALLSLLPLTLVIMSVTGFFLGSQAVETRVIAAVQALVPVSQEAVSETLRVVARTRNLSGAIGVVGLIWASMTVFGAIRKGVNAAWGISKPRPFFQERFIDFTLLTGAGFLIMLPIASTAVAGFLGEFTAVLFPTRPLDGTSILAHISPIVSPLLTFFAVIMLYRFLPNTAVSFRDIWPGALLVALALEGAKMIFLLYAKSVAVYPLVYGPIGALIAILTWFYVSALILLFGALMSSRISADMARKVEEMGLQLLMSFKRARWKARLKTLETPKHG